MDVDVFWELVERSREVQSDFAQAEYLRDLVLDLEVDEVRTFAAVFMALKAPATRWDVWGAGYVLDGGMSNDSFKDFISWLISQGRDVYESTLADPDSLGGERWGDEELETRYPRLTRLWRTREQSLIKPPTMRDDGAPRVFVVHSDDDDRFIAHVNGIFPAVAERNGDSWLLRDLGDLGFEPISLPGDLDDDALADLIRDTLNRWINEHRPNSRTSESNVPPASRSGTPLGVKLRLRGTITSNG